ncbi:MAG TPA: DNA polymerase III subunit gamma/tau [Thermoleophilia bacterium]|nr:DNA polymerase III subunit gamma/tau [Thermoleophilia bacterium]
MKRSLYREYRPQTFSELVGQDHVARTLRNAVETDAVAHAYIFAGPRGTGKTSTARILAKALNCIGPDGTNTAPTATPCGVCRHCEAIAGGVSLDVVEMDAASNRSIDDVRDLRDKIAFAPVDGRFKVYIVDEVHMLTREAFNALLKTLEEPPPDVVFVLATTEAHKIPETIVSRCQRFDFHRPQVTDIVRLLAGIVERENERSEDERGGPRVDIQDEALHIIARHSQGGFRDAIGTLDKLVTYAEGTITAEDVLEALGVTSSDLLFEISDIVVERRTAEALQFVQRLANEGTDYSQFIRDLLRHLRQLFLLQHLEEAASDEATLRTLGQTVELDGELFREQLQRAGQVSPREVVFFIEQLGEAQREIRDGLDPRLQLELALVKVTRPDLDHSQAALEERLRRLEAAAAGAGPAPAAPWPGPAGTPPADTPVPVAAAAATPPRSRPAQPAPADAPAIPAAGPQAPAGDDTAEPERPAATDAPAAPAAPEPAPSAETAAPPAEPAQELTVERVKRAWELILQRVQAARVPLYGFLRDGRPTTLDGEVLVVSLPSEFAARNAAQGDNAGVLADAVEGVLGRRLTPRFDVVAGAATPASAQQTTTAVESQPAAALPDFTDQIRAAQAKLDAELLPDEP